MEGRKYIPLSGLDAYVISREYSTLAWAIYQRLPWQDRKIIGDQMMESVDSIGANIAEGYGRYHYLDKNKFYYNARGSLLESEHWFNLLLERKKISEQEHQSAKELQQRISLTTNRLIKSQWNNKVMSKQ